MLQFRIQSTPNPNARKYILSADVKTEGKVSYKETSECAHVPMAKSLLEVSGVSQVHFFENVITVTQDGSIEWSSLDEKVQDLVIEQIDDHDPNFVDENDNEAERRANLPEEVLRIEEVLDSTIRPGLQLDGGDVEVLGYHANVVTIKYLGACGGCPSSMEGTLEAIKGILRDEIHPDLEVVAL
jgi:Fe-S cluster biogenesis protein NfuA